MLNTVIKENPLWIIQAAAILVGFALVVAIGVLASAEPLIVVLALAGFTLGIASLIWADFAVFLFFLIFLTNTAVIAVRFHNVPYIVGAIFPLFLFVPLVDYIVIKRRKIIITPTMLLLFFYLGIRILGVYRAVEVDTALDAVFGFVVEGVLMYVLIVNVVRDMKMLKRVIVAFLLATIILGAFPLIQDLTKTYDNNYGGYAQVTGRGFDTGALSLQGEVVQPRLEGAIGEKNFFAQIMLMLGMIGLAQVTGAQSWKIRGLALAATGLALVAVTLTFSRGVAVALVGTIIIASMLSVISWRQLAIIIVSSILLLTAFPEFSVRLLSIEDSFAFATGSESTSADASTMGRLTQMLAGVYIYAENPIIGVGPNQYRNYVQDVGNQLGIKRLNETRQAHNIVVDVAANSGTLGLISVFGIFYLTLRDLLRVRRRWAKKNPELSAIAAGFFLAIISYLLTGTFLHMSYDRYIWVVLAVAMATINISKKAEAEQKRLLMLDESAKTVEYQTIEQGVK